MSQELITFNEKQVQVFAKIDAVIDECGLVSAGSQGGMLESIRMASGVRLLREYLCEALMAPIMDLQGSALGFRTDKDKEGGYDMATVRECAIEAMLRGARVTGNEFNIIASRSYLTKEYFQRIMAEMPGLTDLIISIDLPTLGDGGKTAFMRAEAHWVYRGKPDKLICQVEKDEQGRAIKDSRIAVRVNSGQGVDAIHGKAERKLRARIMSRITMTTWSDGDITDAIDVPLTRLAVTDSAPDSAQKPSLKEKMKARQAAAQQPAEEPATPAVTPPAVEPTPPQETPVEAAPPPAEELSPAETPPEVATVPSAADPPPVAVSPLAPLEGESKADYYVRLCDLIKRERETLRLMDIVDEVDRQKAGGFLNFGRHADLVRRLNERQVQLGG